MNGAHKAVIETVRYCMKQENKWIKTWKYREFQQDVYTKWALREILNILIKRQDQPPLQVLEEFKEQMDEYACSGDSKYNYMFSVAYDTAQWVIDLLL